MKKRPVGGANVDDDRCFLRKSEVYQTPPDLQCHEFVEALENELAFLFFDGFDQAHGLWVSLFGRETTEANRG